MESTMYLAVLTQCRSVTDVRTDRHFAAACSALRIALRHQLEKHETFQNGSISDGQISILSLEWHRRKSFHQKFLIKRKYQHIITVSQNSKQRSSCRTILELDCSENYRLRSYNRSLSRPFSPDLNVICFKNACFPPQSFWFHLDCLRGSRTWAGLNGHWRLFVLVSSL